MTTKLSFTKPSRNPRNEVVRFSTCRRFRIITKQWVAPSVSTSYELHDFLCNKTYDCDSLAEAAERARDIVADDEEKFAREKAEGRFE